MIKNQLFQLLKALDRKEMTRFMEFSLSPYFNKHLGVSRLVTYLSSIYPEFTAKNCAKEKLIQQIDHVSGRNKQQLALLFTYTNRLIEKYISQEAIKSQEEILNLERLKHLRQKTQYDVYEKIVRKVEKEMDREPYRDGNYFHHRFLLAQETDLYYTQTTSHQQDDSIQLKEIFLDVFYLSEKLKDACEIQVRRRIIRVDYAARILELVLKEVGDNLEYYSDKPPIVVYFAIYQMMVHEDPIYYDRAFEAVEQHASYFQLAELQSMYNFLQNYCVNKINKGVKRFLKASFELYQVQLERQLLIINDVFPEWYYKNIVTTSLRLNETEWVRQFIETYRGRLDPEVMENAYSFNLASYYFAIEAYDKALRLLLQVAYTDLRYSLSSKALLLRTYYALEEHEALLSLCKSFTQFLQRHKEIADFRRKGYRGLFDLTRKASILRFNKGFVSKTKTQKELSKLKELIEEMEALFNRDWLKEQLQKVKVD